VALGYALSGQADVHGLVIPGDLDRLGAVETDRIRDELVPSVVAYAVSVLTMVVVSGLLTLVMAYWSVYGFSRWGLGEFARTVGQAFDLVTSLIFVLKVFLMSLAVAVIPLAAALDGKPTAVSKTRLQPGATRLFVVLFLIEGATLALRYI
jgi:phospholipid/cholesterol/gamma-HCH transport system permease protein